MIVRAAHDKDNPFFQMLRTTAQDTNLTARALGVMAYLLSKPDSWEPSIDDICRRFKDVGQRQAYKLINEVFIPLRYAKRTQERKDGRIANWLTVIYESPDGENCQVETPDGTFLHGTYQMAVLTTIDNTDKTKQRRKKKKNTDMSGAVLEVFTYWQQKLNHLQAKLTPKRKRLIEARLKDKYTVEQLKLAIDGCAASPFHMGHGPQSDGTIYDDIELICRSGEKVEFFIAKLNRGNGTASKQKTNTYVGKNKQTIGEAMQIEDLAFMDEYIDIAIRANDLVCLARHRDEILKRGGAEHAHEKRVLEFFETPIPGDEPATPEQVAALKDSIAAPTERTRG